MWMVRAGQPARGGEEARMFLKSLKGVGCELDILGTLAWTDPIGSGLSGLVFGNPDCGEDQTSRIGFSV